MSSSQSVNAPTLHLVTLFNPHLQSPESVFYDQKLERTDRCDQRASFGHGDKRFHVTANIDKKEKIKQSKNHQTPKKNQHCERDTK